MADSFIFHTKYLEYIEMLEPELRYPVIRALGDYVDTGNADPDLPPIAFLAFKFIKDRIDVEKIKYEEKKALRAEAGRKGGRPRKKEEEKAEESKEESKEKQTKAKKANAFLEKQNNPVYVFDSVFDTVIDSEKDRRETHKEKVDFPPTVEDVREYCQSAGLDSVDPAFFVNFYAARGWMMGRSKMHDWRSAVISWDLDARKAGRSARAPTKFSNFRARDEDFDKITMDILRQQEKETENEHSDSDGQINA